MTMLSKTVATAALALSLGGFAGLSDSASAMPVNGVATVAAPLAVEHVQFYGGYGYGYRRRFFRPYGYGYGFGPGYYRRGFYGRGIYGGGFYGRGFGYRGYGY